MIRALGTCIMCFSLHAAAAPFVWVEGEAPAKTNFKWKTAGTDIGGMLSQDKWLMPEVREKLSDEGQVVEYDLTVPEKGTYNLWLRVGFEWIRPHVAWRFGEGKWTTVGIGYPRPPQDESKKSPDAGIPFDFQRRSTNVKEVGFWAEVAWWHVGEAELATGTQHLTLRFLKTHIEDPLLAVDAVVLVQGKWTPDGRLKPGETYDAEIDRRAASQVFELPPAAGPAERVAVRLDGPWQVARFDDPDMDVDTLVPVSKIPTAGEYDLKWMGMDVPASLWSHKEMTFGHRAIYRTRVRIPANHQGRGLRFHFSGTNWIASVFVDGKIAGTHRGVWVPWDLDVSRFITPGATHELAIAIKGSYYAADAKSMGRGPLDVLRNRPRSRLQWVFWVAPIYPSTKGDGDGVDFGIVNPVSLSSVGTAYTDDVFVKPSVARKRLESDVTVRNTLDRERRLSVACEAISDPGGQVEKAFDPVSLTVPPQATATVTVAGAWENPKLWWPEPKPNLYRLRTKILEDGKALDTHEQLFGFREVTVDGPSIRINGVRRNFWNWVDVPGPVWSPEDYLSAWQRSGNRFMRFSCDNKISRVLKTREECLEFFDRNGLAGRLCSMIDGMFISFGLGRGFQDPQTKQNRFEVNEAAWEGFREHIDQFTRAYRNHPSVIMYQIENELIYINGCNMYGGYLDILEAEMLKVYEAGYRNDPTRPYTVGGGGDLGKARDAVRTLEINSPHYPEGDLDWYPENAYTVDRYAQKIERWPWDRKKPWVVGESAFANEIPYATYVDGSRAYRDMHAADRGKAKFLRMLYGGYRWAGVAGFFPWTILDESDDGRKIFSDLYIVPRKQTHRLFAGQENSVLVKVMNDTLKADPVTFEWSYECGGRKVAGNRAALTIEPGFGVEQTLRIPAPETETRIDGVLTLKSSQPGAPDYTDVRPVPVLPRVKSVRTTVPVMSLDRSGKLDAFLDSVGAKAQKLANIDDIRERSGLLVIGPDTLKPAEAFGQDILLFAAKGGKVIVLEQEVPVSGQNLPCPLKTTPRYGGYAHPQALGMPVYRDLGPDDLIDWAGDHPTYKNVYVKPSSGARSLAECGPELPYSALVEMAAGKGVIVVCQLRVGAKLRQDPAADVLLRNLIEYYSSYQPPAGIAAVYLPNDSLAAAKTAEMGLFTEPVDSLEKALDRGKYLVAIVGADEAAMGDLLRLKGRAEAFQQAGGWIMLMGVSPKSIDPFNRLMATSHLLRPFRVERVTLADSGCALAATLGTGDIAFYSAEHIMHGRYWLSGDLFSHVIDGVDAAPFTIPPGAPPDPYAYKPTKDDHDPYNFVNGCFSSDFWRYICQIWIPQEGPQPLTFALRQPETLRQVNIWNNAFYWTIKDLDIIFDGDAGNAVRTQLPDSAGLTEVRLAAPKRVEKTVTIQIRTWRERKTGRPDLRLVGIDNVQFLRAEAPPKAVFIDSVGGLVAFPKGKGGVFVNQVKFLKDEDRKVNASKKLNLVSVILQNMGVGSRASAAPVPGYNLKYDTVELTDFCNHYLSDRQGKVPWFGQKGQDLRGLQVGKHHLGNVMYHVVDYATAPVPDCIVLGAAGAPAGLKADVTGIKVGKKADALFFLHTARVTAPISVQERQRMNDPDRPVERPEVVRYVIRYVDGQTAEIPVLLGRDIDHWLQAEALGLEGAAVAWTSRIEGLDGQVAVLYSMKALNPRPDVEIATIDAVVGKDAQGRPVNRAVPALVAITLGNVIK